MIKKLFYNKTKFLINNNKLTKNQIIFIKKFNKNNKLKFIKKYKNNIEFKFLND